jgi:proteasome lid subunit RPN8/RPN11
MADMRNQSEKLFAIYHSHPKAPAQPSIYDLEAASYPDALYLIISLNTKGVLEMRGFKISKKSSEEVVLSLLEE